MAKACGEDDSLRPEVQSLLAYEDQAEAEHFVVFRNKRKTRRASSPYFKARFCFRPLNDSPPRITGYIGRDYRASLETQPCRTNQCEDRLAKE